MSQLTQATTPNVFKSAFRNANHAFVATQQPEQCAATKKAVFVLLEHFSMSAFSVAVDTLVTTNLLHPFDLYSIQTCGVSSQQVLSDLSFLLPTDTQLSDVRLDENSLIIVCGGYRNRLATIPLLTRKLKEAVEAGALVCGIWNGAFYMAEADVLGGDPIAIHQNNHALLQERFPGLNAAEKTFHVGRQALTCAGPNSVLDMMLEYISGCHGKELAIAVEEVIGRDRGRVETNNALHPLDNAASVPNLVKNAVRLMQANIEEPLTIEEIARLLGSSRRQIERLFNEFSGASPARYYMEMRLTRARQLLQQSSMSITDISVACGFVSSSHFSRNFRRFFNQRPVDARKQNSKRA